MPIIVQKYGGTSVGSVERIQAVADRVVAAREAGNDVVVVVSAMGHTTDELLAMATEIAPIPDPRELDMLLTAGERIAMSLLGIAINARGCRAASYTGSQAGIMTDTRTREGQDRRDPAQADPRSARSRQRRGAGRVPGIVCEPVRDHDAGSRRFRPDGGGHGRGVGAEVCEIYTDVEGVFTTRSAPRGRRRASSTWSPTTRCSRWPPRARTCCNRARWSTRVATV